MHINLFTGNKSKIATARSVFDVVDIEVKPLSLDIPEIQADTNLEVASHSATQAAKIINEPVAREDHGFILNAFPGWPGPYMAHAERVLAPEDVLRLLSGKDRSAYFEIAMVYSQPSGETKSFVYQIPCQITEEVRGGEDRFGWNSIIRFEDDARAFSEYPKADRYQTFAKNYSELAKLIKNP